MPIASRRAATFVLAAWACASCKDASQVPPVPPTADPVAASRGAPAATPSPRAPASAASAAVPATSGSAAPTAPPGCALWSARPIHLVARDQAGHAEQYRELRYDGAKPAAEAHASSPLSKGATTRRVVDRTRMLTRDEARAVEDELTRVCPDDAAMAARCAPGGCARLRVGPPGRETTVEDAETVRKVMAPLERLFPELKP